MHTKIVSYEHKQTAPTYLILVPVFVIVAFVTWQSRHEGTPLAVCLVAGLAFAILASSFAHLVVKDDGDHLLLHFGPLPLFKKRTRYIDMESAAPGRSSLIDGWGIHYRLGRGWIFNLWGFDCAEIRVKGKLLRIGSDDVPELVAFLRSKISVPAN